MAFVRYSTMSVTLLHYVAGENYMMLLLPDCQLLEYLFRATSHCMSLMMSTPWLKT